MSRGSFLYLIQKSGVAKDFVKRFYPSPGNVASRTIQDPFQSPAWLGILGDLFVPCITLLKLKVSQPAKEFLSLVITKSLDLLGNLFDSICGHSSQYPLLRGDLQAWGQSCSVAANAQANPRCAARVTVDFPPKRDRGTRRVESLLWPSCTVKQYIEFRHAFLMAPSLAGFAP